MCVRYADRIAYLTHDALDAIRAGLLSEGGDFPPSFRRHRFGSVRGGLNRGDDRRGRWGSSPWLPVSCAWTSGPTGRHERVARLHVPAHLPGTRPADAQLGQAIDVIRRLVELSPSSTPRRCPTSYRDTEADRITQVVDYVAGMTDRFALATHERLFGTPGMWDPIL